LGHPALEADPNRRTVGLASSRLGLDLGDGTRLSRGSIGDDEI
jgi:hypothetical protein